LSEKIQNVEISIDKHCLGLYNISVAGTVKMPHRADNVRVCRIGKVQNNMIDLKTLFQVPGETRQISCKVLMADIKMSGFYPFPTPITVCGRVENEAGIITLRYTAVMDMHVVCDRCLTELDKRQELTFTHVLVTELSNEDDDSYLVVEDGLLDIEELVVSDILLAMPSKFLCKADCKGLCPTCGTNLNDSECSCEKKQYDPRLEALKGLLQ